MSRKLMLNQFILIRVGNLYSYDSIRLIILIRKLDPLDHTHPIRKCKNTDYLTDKRAHDRHTRIDLLNLKQDSDGLLWWNLRRLVKDKSWISFTTLKILHLEYNYHASNTLVCTILLFRLLVYYRHV